MLKHEMSPSSDSLVVERLQIALKRNSRKIACVILTGLSQEKSSDLLKTSNHRSDNPEALAHIVNSEI
jgi:hypothetical protein